MNLNIHIPGFDRIITPRIPEKTPFNFTDAQKYTLTRPILRRLIRRPLTTEQQYQAIKYARPTEDTGEYFYRGISLLEALQFITEGRQTSTPETNGNQETLLSLSYDYANGKKQYELPRVTDDDYKLRTGMEKNELIRRFGTKIENVLNTPVILEINKTRESGVFEKRTSTADDTVWRARPPITVNDLTPRCIQTFQDVFGIDLNKYRAQI